MTTVDSTGGNFKVYYFPIQNEAGLDNYETLKNCFTTYGISGCYNYATLWSTTKLE